MPQPGEIIRMSPETKVALGHELRDLITDLERDHSQYFNSLKHWWDWYHAKPLTEIRTDPWLYASNVVVPIIRTAADAIMARLHGRLHTPRTTWNLTTENSEVREVLKPIQQYINLESRNTFDIQRPTKDWVGECVVIGESVLWAQWKKREAWRFRPGSKKPVAVELSRGPLVEHVPREFNLWRKDRTIAESDVLVRRNNMFWSEIALEMQRGDWDSEDSEHFAQQTGGHGPSQEILESKRELFGVETGHEGEPHDIRECWVEWPLAQLLTNQRGVQPLSLAGADDPSIPIVVTLHRETGRVLRAVAHPYFHGRWPAFDIYFRKMPGMASSYGVSKMLEHIQRAVTTTTNQSIDSVTLSNSLKLVTQSPTVKDKRFNPFHPFYVENLEDIKELNVSKQIQPDIALNNMLVAIGERVIGISDPMLGRETRMGGHPSPATNTLVQLQEGSKLFDMTLRDIRLSLSAVGEFIFSMQQQFELDEESGKLAEWLGPKDAETVREALITPENFRFDVMSLSETVNPEAERNNAVLVDQLTSNYYAFVLKILPLTEGQAGPAVAAAATKAVEAKGLSLMKALEAMDVDDPEELVFRLQEARREFAGNFGVGQLGQGAPGQSQGPVPGGAVAPAAAGAGGNGAAVAEGLGSGFQL